MKQIREAFESARHPRGTWEDFENHAADFFRQVREKSERFIRTEEQRIAEMRRVLDAY